MMEMPLYDEEINQNQTPLFVGEYQNHSNSSISSQSEFSKDYQYLCSKCKEVPIINFTSKGKIIFICECNESPRELDIEAVYIYLYKSKEIEHGNNNLFSAFWNCMHCNLF